MVQFCNVELREISERVKEVIGLVNVANKAVDRTDPVCYLIILFKYILFHKFIYSIYRFHKSTVF